MGLPTPIYKLSGHCSIVHQQILYVYSPAGFQALPLGKGGEWETLPMDISLTGAQCVKAVPGGDDDSARLYVVGGTPNATAADWDYPGLMYYSIKDKKWDWIRSESYSMQNRLNHAAIYLDDAKSIFVFSGSQTGYTGASSETFLMKIEAPFTAISSSGPLPLSKPQLKQWDDSRALMLGGDGNTALYTFHATQGWTKLTTALTAPIASSDVYTSLVSGTDGSKVLEEFDTTVSPNKVSRYAILNAGGVAATTGTQVGNSKTTKTKRLTLANWPAYNSSNAPTATRTGASIAQGDDDTVVISGGSTSDPICIFDEQLNSWKNATALFDGGNAQNVLGTATSTSSASATATATPTPSASATSSTDASSVPQGATVNNKDRMLTVLGATLGTIFGIAVVLILLLFCLKWRKRKNKQQAASYQEKDRLSFADRGQGPADDYMSEAGMKFQEANMSQTSLAIIAGRATGHKKGMLSDASTSGLIKKTSPLGYSDPVELDKFNLKPEPIPEALVRQNSGRLQHTAAANLSRSRSSGWSRYFANNEATNLAQMPSDRSTYASDRTSTASTSMYTDSRYNPSQAIAPLEIPQFDGQRVSKVARGSPTLGNSQETLPGVAMQAQLSRADSSSSTNSGYSRDDHYLRNGVDSWSPVNNEDRPASSNYTGSVVIDDYRQNGAADSYYAADNNSYYPKSNYSSFYPGQKLGEPEIRESTGTLFPSANNAGSSQQPQSSTFGELYPPPRIGGGEPAEGRESTVTVFPGLHAGLESKPQQDMSWLNLGTNAGK